MAVTRITDKVSNIVESTLMQRADPLDQVQWEVTSALDQNCDCDCPDDDDVVHGVTLVTIFIALECPELGVDEDDNMHASVAQIGIPLRSLNDDKVRWAVNQMWDGVVSTRLEHANGLTG